MTKLKRICCHPFLLDNECNLQKNRSGKWDLFVELSTEILASGRKFVVFSQYLGMLELMEKYFHDQKIATATIHGGMSVGQRQQMVERFEHDDACKVFCASLLAGGEGIDLTAAGAVIHYDRWWNSAKEEQATARVHRMGQKDVVQVFRLITQGTLEERIHAMIQEKKELTEDLIWEDDASMIKALGNAELKAFLGLS